jgi:hypothetical protein
MSLSTDAHLGTSTYDEHHQIEDREKRNLCNATSVHRAFYELAVANVIGVLTLTTLPFSAVLGLAKKLP